jgi:hypothetical protein
VTSNPNWDQFGGRSVPFGGDYPYISAAGGFSHGTWTDWRDVRPGSDLRESGDADSDHADVFQCRTVLPGGSISGDTCPWQESGTNWGRRLWLAGGSGWPCLSRRKH